MECSVCQTGNHFCLQADAVTWTQLACRTGLLLSSLNTATTRPLDGASLSFYFINYNNEIKVCLIT